MKIQKNEFLVFSLYDSEPIKNFHEFCLGFWQNVSRPVTKGKPERVNTVSILYIVYYICIRIYIYAEQRSRWPQGGV